MYKNLAATPVAACFIAPVFCRLDVQDGFTS